MVSIGDVQASAVQECIAALRKDGKRIKTANDYLDAVKGFTRRLWRDRRTPTNLLAGMSGLANREAKYGMQGGTLPPVELRRLLDAARTRSTNLHLLSGIDWYFLYLTACATGFRTQERSSPETKNPGKHASFAVLRGKGQQRKQMEPRGIEPLTSALRTHALRAASLTGPDVKATPAPACTSACTSEGENENADTVEALAALLRGLSAADRTRLAGLLAGEQPEGASK
jgi:hypothetical protein